MSSCFEIGDVKMQHFKQKKIKRTQAYFSNCKFYKMFVRSGEKENTLSEDFSNLFVKHSSKFYKMFLRLSERKKNLKWRS